MYSTVSVVLFGANPNVCVFKKLLGSNDSSNLDIPLPNDEPTLSGFGIISSSGLSLTPAPNLNSVFPSGLLYVVNLLDTLFSFNKKSISEFTS